MYMPSHEGCAFAAGVPLILVGMFFEGLPCHTLPPSANATYMMTKMRAFIVLPLSESEFADDAALLLWYVLLLSGLTTARLYR